MRLSLMRLSIVTTKCFRLWSLLWAQCWSLLICLDLFSFWGSICWESIRWFGRLRNCICSFLSRCWYKILILPATSMPKSKPANDLHHSWRLSQNTIVFKYHHFSEFSTFIGSLPSIKVARCLLPLWSLLLQIYRQEVYLLSSFKSFPEQYW